MPLSATSPAAAAVYGKRGSARQMRGPPQSLEEHINEAMVRVPNLSPRDRNAIRNVMLQKTRDLDFIRLIMEGARGPWSERAAQPEGPKGWWET